MSNAFLISENEQTQYVYYINLDFCNKVVDIYLGDTTFGFGPILIKLEADFQDILFEGGNIISKSE